MSNNNPAHEYRQVAKQIVSQVKQTLIEALEIGKMPDPYWKLEQAIIDAMRLADQKGQDRAAEQFSQMIKEFDENDGTSRN